MGKFRVVVVGGYGFFGSRLVERLARRSHLDVIVGGRNVSSAKALIQRLLPDARSALHAAYLDAQSASFREQLKEWAPDVVVHTSGPFQWQAYQVAEACIALGTNYIDLADGREFVTGIGALDTRARAAGVVVTSGASSVPALSSAAADHLVRGMTRVQSIEIGISPGNRTERGLSTIQGILSYCGKPIPRADGGEDIGWSHSYRHVYADPVGQRLLSPCDVPDLALLPSRYPGSPIVRFGAGLELGFLHRGMNLMAWAARAGLVKNWTTHATRLKQAADCFKGWGSENGAMHVHASGFDAQGAELACTWELLAVNGDGPFVPTLAAAAIIEKLSKGMAPAPGARACMGLLTLDDFLQASSGSNISTRTYS